MLITPLRVATMFVEPVATPVTTPMALTVAFIGEDVVHIAIAVISELLPSENTPFARNARVEPTGTMPEAGSSVMRISVALEQLSVVIAVTGIAIGAV